MTLHLALVTRLAAAAAALAILCLLALHPRPELVRGPACPTLIGDATVNLCALEVQRVTLPVADPALPPCTPQELAMVLPGFTPATCMVRR